MNVEDPVSESLQNARSESSHVARKNDQTRTMIHKNIKNGGVQGGWIGVRGSAEHNRGQSFMTGPIKRLRISIVADEKTRSHSEVSVPTRIQNCLHIASTV